MPTLTLQMAGELRALDDPTGQPDETFSETTCRIEEMRFELKANLNEGKPPAVCDHLNV